MADTRKSYGEGCLAAHALDLIGDRWTLLIARELMFGPRRFGELAEGLPGIATNMLSRRLEEMQGAALLVREGRGYRLTPAGEGLWPVLAALCEVGRRMPGHDPRLPISPAALMLSMRVTLDPQAQGAHDAAFVMDGQGFTVWVRDGRLLTARDADPQGACRFEGPANLMAVAVYGPSPLATLPGISGDLVRGQAFVDLFSLTPQTARSSLVDR